MRALPIALALTVACGRSRIYEPEFPPSVTTPAPPMCMTGAITGRICAPDQMTWLNGATVWVDTVDCNGMPLKVATVSGNDGTFNLVGVPVGAWDVHVELGSFSQTMPSVVTAGQVLRIPDGGLCIAQQQVRIAVISGAGDKIETLLLSLGLKVTVFPGGSNDWLGHASLFLTDPGWMSMFDLIFIDCAAASSPGSHIDFGPNAQAIEANLRAFVQAGGSVYASDWALLFAAYAAPDAFSAVGVPALASPLDTTQLKGFAPQTLTATIEDNGLQTFLGKPAIDINFPAHTSVHWGLVAEATGATVLASADGVQTCADPGCLMAGPVRDHVPLAVTLKVTPVDQRGGRVLYTSFHNIAQSGDDVAKMLKYLVLHL